VFLRFRDWPLRWKLLVSPGIVVVAAVVAALLANYVLQQQREVAAEREQTLAMRDQRLSILRIAMVKSDLALFRAITWRSIGVDPGVAESLRAMAETQFSSVAVLAGMIDSRSAVSTEEAPLVLKIREAANSYEAGAREALDAFVTGSGDEMPRLAEAGRRYAVAEAAIRGWENYHVEAKRLLDEQAAAEMHRATMGFLAAALAAFGVAIMISFLIGRAISNGVVGVTKAMGRLAAGDTAMVIAVPDRADEVGQLTRAAKAFKLSLRALARANAEHAAAEAENRAAEQAQVKLLAASEERLRDLAESASDWFWETDAEDRLTMVSDRFFAVTGFSPDDILGTTRLQFAKSARSQEDAAKWVTYAKDIAARRPFRNLDYSLQTRAGRLIHIRSSGKPFFADDGTFKGYRGTSSDITALVDAQREALQSSRLASVGQLAAGIAHEINTPIQYVGDNLRFFDSSLKSMTDAIKAVEAATAEVPEVQAKVAAILEAADIPYLLEELPAAAQQSLDGVEHVGRIVRSMKEFSHPGSSAKVMTDLNRAIESTLIVTTNEWKHTARVEKDLDPNLPQILCLPADVNQVLLNLIVNASHALEGQERQGVIRISTRAEADAIEIRIADNGPGVPETLRERVFDPFFTTKAVGKGTGQGLAIAMDVVVNKHGGRLSVEETEGGGATFVVRLPKAAAEAERETG